MPSKEHPYSAYHHAGNGNLQNSGTQIHGTKGGKYGEAYWSQGYDQFSCSAGQHQYPPRQATPVKPPPRKAYDLNTLVAEYKADRAYYDNSNRTPYERFQIQPSSENAWTTFDAGQPRKQHATTETKVKL